jgi:hypothetical protein
MGRGDVLPTGIDCLGHFELDLVRDVQKHVDRHPVHDEALVGKVGMGA